jgi:beta-glucosidase
MRIETTSDMAWYDHGGHLSPGYLSASMNSTRNRASIAFASIAFAACSPSAPAPKAPPAPAATGAASTTAVDAGTTAADLTALASLPPDPRADALVARMTAEEKFAYIGGDKSLFIRAVPRLGIPEIKMSDGPAGCRHWGPSTAYPSGTEAAAAFDEDEAQKMGAAIGRDCRARGVHILLAPGVNISRSPLAGRNFEYMGEDPFLAGKTAAAYIRGVQSEGVLATVKHFAANNQEWDRNHISSEVDERTLREIYFPAFERAVREGGVHAVMTAYNLLNGTYCSENAWLLHDVLEGQWGFQGFVMSDWGAVHDALGGALGGCDLEMPSGKQMNEGNLAPLVASKKLDMRVIDDKVRRILRTIIAAGFLDRPRQESGGNAPLDYADNAAVALDVARRGVVLLKNTGNVLPLDRTKIKRIAVIGPNANPAVVSGHGSAFITPYHAVSLLDGVKQAAAGVDVTYHPGVQRPSDFQLVGKPCFAGPVKQEVFAGKDPSGAPVATATVDRIDVRRETPALVPSLGSDYSVRWTGEVDVPKAGSYRLISNTEGSGRVRLDGKAVIDNWKDHPTATDMTTVELTPGKHTVVVEYAHGADLSVAEFGFGEEAREGAFEGGADVTKLAKSADAVIVSVGFGQGADTNSVKAPFGGHWPPAWARKKGIVESEDSDRPFELPAAQIETIRLARAANPRTIVVINAGSGVDMQKFAGEVPAVVWAFYPGQEGGHAVADVLFGDVNPSGKLPFTIAKRYSDYPSAPYYNVDTDKKTPYTEGIFVGYRGFDAKNIEPAFPFGFGLSYTSFAYSGVRIEAGREGQGSGDVKVTVHVTNRGKRAGDEIVQVYVAPPKSGVPRPPKELKGFARVSLAPGEAKDVSVVLESRAFAYWNDRDKQWSVEAGTYKVLVGASSRDIRGTKDVLISARTISPASAP